MGKLEVNNLSVNIDGKIYLNEINFVLNQGKVLVIIGESGSGKTMLSKLLIGQRPEDLSEITGEILFDKENLLTINSKMWKMYRGKEIAYIAQNPMALFNPKQSILSHAIELFKSHYEINDEECKDKLINVLKSFNLKNPEIIINKYPFQLSGGMLQRIMFAMMMELSPKLIIADEPTSALDEHNTQTIIDTLKQSHGASMLVITHDYELVKQLADDVIILKDGSIIEQGEAKTILNNPETDYGKALLSPKNYTRYGQV